MKAVRLSNGREWRSRKGAKAHFTEMLGRYKDGQVITDAADDSDLRALLERYDSVLPPGAETKVGVGVAHFSRERNAGDGWATSGFHVHRTDDSTIDFSFYRAIEVDVL